MAFENNARDLQRGDSGQMSSAHTEGDTAGRRGPGGAILAVLCGLLIASGFFLMYADMQRDIRHGVCRSESGRMLELPVEPDREKIEEAAKGISVLSKAHPEILQYMMLIPSAACIQQDYLPTGTETRDQKADLAMIRGSMPAGLSWIDLVDSFQRHSGERLYYFTDIYLTGWGSRYAADSALSGMGIETQKVEEERYLLSDSFEGKFAFDGTLKQRLPGSKKEHLEIYVPKEEVLYYRIDDASGKAFGSLYDSSAVDGAEKYNVFFGGERSLTEIRTAMINEEILLVVGDREADCIVPRLVPYFEKIILVHPSKCSKTMEKLISDYQPTKILYLYGANSYMKDRTLLRTLSR